jgi:hypothetical protein
LCWLEGYKSHSAVKWGREGWALLVFHGKDVDGTDGQGWRLREKEDALKRYDMDTAEVLYWVRLPVIP